MCTTLPHSSPAAPSGGEGYKLQNDLAAAGRVRTIGCPLCSAVAGWSCTMTGSHLARWLRAFALGLITRDELVGAVRGLVVISASQLVEERAA